MVSYVNLVGSREAPDKTIRALLQNNWVAGNTLGKTPVFQSESEEPDINIADDYADENQVTIAWFLSQRVQDQANEPNGDSIHHWMHRLVVNSYGETMAMALLMIDEINRIIWQFSPNGGTRLNKSDGSSSEADYFERTEIHFERIAPKSAIDNRPNFEGVLEIHFRKHKS